MKNKIMWLATATTKELRTFLKEKGVKGLYKLRKKDMLEVAYNILFTEQIAFPLKEPEVKTMGEPEAYKIKQMVDDYKEEVKVRTDCDVKEGDILLDLLTHNKVTFAEFRKFVFENNIDIALGKDKAETSELNWGNHNSCLDQYNESTSKSYFDTVPSEEFPFDEISKCWVDEPSELDLLEANNRSYTVDDITVALQYNAYYPHVTVYNKDKLIGCYCIGTSSKESVIRVIYEQIDTYTEAIKRLAEYDGLDQKTMIKCYDGLVKQYNEYILKEKEANYKARKKVWNEKIGSNFRIKFTDVYNEWAECIDNEKYYEAYEAKGWGKRTWFGDNNQYSMWKEYTKEEKEDRERTYQKSYKQSNNYNSYNYSNSYSSLTKSNYTDEEKGYLKKIYKAAALNLHPDKGGSPEAMKLLNSLKTQWGI